MNDVIITRGTGGLGRKTESLDAISALVCNGVAVVGGVQLATAYRLATVDDAIALGIDADYDVDNGVLVFEHINEFFRIAPNGVLWLYMVAQNVLMATLVSTHAKALLKKAGGEIKRVGIAGNPTTEPDAFEPEGETPSDQINAVTAAQTLATSEFAAHRPILFIIEGKNYTVSATPFNIRSLNSKDVMVVIGQSAATAAVDDIFQTYAAVGTALGCRAAAAVNVKHSWVQKFNCFGGSLTSASINGNLIDEIADGTLDAIDAAGGQFFRTHTGISGYYFNHTATAVEATSDYAYAEATETMNKASRLVRIALLPYLDSPQKIDPKTGKLSPEVIKFFEATGRAGLAEMLRNDEVSGIDVFVDPNQNLLATSQLDVNFEITPTGSSSRIRATINFKNPFNS